MTQANSLQESINRLARGNKVYNGGSPSPTSKTFSNLPQTTTRPQQGQAFSNLPLDVNRRVQGPAGTGISQPFQPWNRPTNTGALNPVNTAFPKNKPFEPSKGLVFDPNLAAGERSLQRQLEELMALTGQQRGRTREDFSVSMDRLRRDARRGNRDISSDLGGRGMFGSTPGIEQLGRFNTDVRLSREGLGRDQERRLADIETLFTRSQGSISDSLGEIGRKRAELTRQRDLERANKQAREQTLKNERERERRAEFNKEIPHFYGDQLYIDDNLLAGLANRGITPNALMGLKGVESDSSIFNQLQKGSGGNTLASLMQSLSGTQAAASEDPRLARLMQALGR